MSLPALSKLSFPTPVISAQVQIPANFYMNISNTAVTMSDGSIVQPWQFWVKDGKLVKIYGKDSLKMWVTKILKTEKNKYYIYSK